MLKIKAFSVFITMILAVSCSQSTSESDELTSEYFTSEIEATPVGIVVAHKERLEHIVKTTGVLIPWTETSLILGCEITQSEKFLLKIGNKAKIYLANNPGKEIPGQVVDIGRMINPATKMIPVKVQLMKTVNYYPGMPARVEIIVPGRVAVVIPNQAVVSKSGRKVVFTMSHGLAKWNDVVLGQAFRDDIEVLSGIKEGDTVINENASPLTHNSRVVERPD